MEGHFDVHEGKYTGLDAGLYECLDAVGRGVSIGEILWGDGKDRVFLKDLRFKPQHLFAFGQTSIAPYSTQSYRLPATGPLHLRNGVLVEGVDPSKPLPENKFLVASFRPQYSNRWGTPLYRKVFWPSWFKRAGMRQFLRYLEKGAGSVVSRYPDGAPASEQQKALDAARAINEESAVAIPNKFMVEVLEHVRQSMGDSYSQLIDDISNNAIMRVILGQTLTGRGGEGSGGWSRGDVHQRVRSEKIESDSKFLMYVVNANLVWPLTLFNAGPVARPPMWVIDYEPQMDLSAISTWLGRLWTMRVRIPTGYVRKIFQIPEPAEGEEVLPEPAGAQPSLPESGVDSSADFAEKKTPESGNPSNNRSGLRMHRFARLRPSMMKSLSE
jgi:phage gp29-like protein